MVTVLKTSPTHSGDDLDMAPGLTHFDVTTVSALINIGLFKF